MRTQGVFEYWDFAPAALPPRSRLYALEPIGVGTPFVESLSGYVVRLADAHAVSVGDLVGRELSRVAPKPLTSFGQFMKQNRANSHGFYARKCSISGFGKTSERWIEALERATLRTTLRFLTLSPFDGAFSWQGGVSRDTRVWCPRCFVDWRNNDAVIYEPLLWSVGIVTLCPRHLIPLVEECPHCHSRSKPLAVFSRPGLCSHCHEWLGVPSSAASSGTGTDGPDIDDALWRAETVGELLANAPRLEHPSLQSVLIANLRACVDNVAGGNLDAFAAACQVSRSPFESHLTGRSVPTIDILLRICRRLSIPMIAFLESDPRRASAYWERARQSVDPTQMVSAFRPVEQVQLALLQRTRKTRSRVLQKSQDAWDIREQNASTKWIGIFANGCQPSIDGQGRAIAGGNVGQKESPRKSTFKSSFRSPSRRTSQFRRITLPRGLDMPTRDTYKWNSLTCAGRSGKRSLPTRQRGLPRWKGFSQKP
jgi:hypothetical protein